MRRLISTCSILALSSAASAHTLAEGAGLIAQLAHQLLSSHHFPLALLLLIVVMVAVRAIGRSGSN